MRPATIPDALFLALAHTVATTGLDSDGDSNCPVYLVASDRWWAAYYAGTGHVLVLAVEEPAAELSGIVRACCESSVDAWRWIPLADIPQAPRAAIVAAVRRHRPAPRTPWSPPVAEA